MKFKLKSIHKPAGDQPAAIKELLSGLKKGKKEQVLLGATATGKTFTVANVIKAHGKPTLILSHNKTLAAQLYSEVKGLFPDNKVEYFISNFDYYRPEAYMPTTDTFIDKTSKSNWDIEAMRMSAINSLATREDVIVIASVAAIYGQLNPEEYKASFISFEKGQKINRTDLIMSLVKINYSRNDVELTLGTFRAKGDVIEIAPSWTQEYFVRIDMFGDEIENIVHIDVITGEKQKHIDLFILYPADAYTTRKETVDKAVITIKTELMSRLKYFKKENKLLEEQRIEQRVNQDLESLSEFGLCSGIENYSRHFDQRKEGVQPYTILNYLPEDALIILDESHLMVPQLNAMYKGDRSRKQNLVDYGFRLPSALDNRPLRFPEFRNFNFPTIYLSATPGPFELDLVSNNVVSQIVRPTGLLDPTIEIYPTHNQVEDIFNRIQKQKEKNERTFIITTTKKMAEELSKYLKERGEKIMYLHSDHKTFERNEILRKLRLGVYDVVVGVNLIREGIDIPEVSLMCVLQADHDSFFRSASSLIQIIGRAARNTNGHAVFYADKISKSMKAAIEETDRRRQIQSDYNIKHSITPKTIVKPIPEAINAQGIDGAIDEFMQKGKKDKIAKKEFIQDLRRQMLKASKDLDFERAAQLRDTIIELQVMSEN